MTFKTRNHKTVLLVLASVLFLFTLNAFALFLETNRNKIPDSEEVVQFAMKFINERKFIRSGKMLDCSGFTSTIYHHFNIYLPPSSKDQIKCVKCTDIDQLCAGDLVFFITNGKGISHVGIYICNNEFIHSPGKHDKVRIDSLTHSYWKEKFACGGQIKRFEFN